MLWTEDGRVRPPSPLAVWRAVVISAGLAFIAYDCVANLRSPTRGAESVAASPAPQAAVTSKSVRVIELARHTRSEAEAEAEAEPVEPVGAMPLPDVPLSKPEPLTPLPALPQTAAIDVPAPQVAEASSRQTREDRGDVCARYHMHRVDYTRHGYPYWHCMR
jgi:hypothetical protein